MQLDKIEININAATSLVSFSIKPLKPDSEYFSDMKKLDVKV